MPETKEFKMIAVESSTIEKIGWDSMTLKLRIEFRSGSLYEYENVGGNLAAGLIFAQSHGSYFAKHLRNNANYPCTKLAAVEA